MSTTALEMLEDLVHRYDADLEFNVACMTAWAGQLRLTLTNPQERPSRSITFYSAGGADPEGVAQALLAEVEAWLADSDVKPMPVPNWMRH